MIKDLQDNLIFWEWSYYLPFCFFEIGCIHPSLFYWPLSILSDIIGGLNGTLNMLSLSIGFCRGHETFKLHGSSYYRYYGS